MKKKACLIPITVLILLALTLQAQGIESSSKQMAYTGTSNSTQLIGVNYLSMYNEYSTEYTSNETLNRDFTRFQQDGISVISLSLYWYRLEGNIRGDYNGTYGGNSYYGDAFLENIKRVLTIADQHGIECFITIHTLWGESDSPWCTPSYVIDPISGKNIGLAIVRSTDMRQAFLDMVNHTVSYLAGTPGIYAWAVLNEPWYWGRTSNEHDFITENGRTQKDNFITLIQNLTNIVKIIDDKPVTVRFCSTSVWNSTDGANIKNIFAEDWNWDQRIFSTLDFISFNDYLPIDTQLQSRWREYTQQNIAGSEQHNASVWITEFGCSSDNDAIQADQLKTMLNLYGTLSIKGCLAWEWNDGAGRSDESAQKGMNICANGNNGQARQAYYDLTSYRLM